MTDSTLWGIRKEDGTIERMGLTPKPLDPTSRIVPVEIVEAGTAERVKRLEALAREAVPHAQSSYFAGRAFGRPIEGQLDWLARAEKELGDTR